MFYCPQYLESQKLALRHAFVSMVSLTMDNKYQNSDYYYSVFRAIIMLERFRSHVCGIARSSALHRLQVQLRWE
jgi:hypothetical protein